MLIAAARADLGFLDAGGAQPVCEAMLGEHLPRPVPMGVLIRSVRGDRGPDAVEAEVRASLMRLRLTKARAVVVQSASDLFAGRRPRACESLEGAARRGPVRSSSASASTPPTIRWGALARRFKPDLAQALFFFFCACCSSTAA